MTKPILNFEPSEAELSEITETFDEKKIVGRAKKAGVEILFLEDGSEVIRGKNGQFLDNWPKGA